MLLTSCYKQQKPKFIPIITDSIPTSTVVLNSSKMMEGGYDLVGFQKIGKDFKIQNLEEKERNYEFECLKNSDLYKSLLNSKPIKVKNINEYLIRKSITYNYPIDIIEEEEDIFKKTLDSSKDFMIYVDINQILNIPLNDLIYKESSKSVSKNFNYVEYSNKIKASYAKYYKPLEKQVQAYPVTIYNISDSICYLDVKEGWPFMLQEAKNEKGEWRPIEFYDDFAFCGNSFWSKEFLPKYYTISKVYKYQGNFKTKLRLKLRTGNNIIYSNEYSGTINLEQFYHPKNNNSTANKRRFFLAN